MLSFVLLWSAIGCGLFFLMVVALFRTGLVFTARKEDGTLKDEIPLRGKMAMLIIPSSYFVFQVFSNYISLVGKDFALTFASLFLLNYSVYLVLFLFDTFFIDGFVLAVWRPAFLRLPEAMGKESMRKHIIVSVPIGLLVGALLTLVSTIVSCFVWIC